MNKERANARKSLMWLAGLAKDYVVETCGHAIDHHEVETELNKVLHFIGIVTEIEDPKNWQDGEVVGVYDHLTVQECDEWDVLVCGND